MKSGISRANQNKEIRQQAIREQLVAGGHLQHVIEITNKLADLTIPLDSSEVSRLKAAADNHYKLLDKYLPNLKPVDSEENSEMKIKISVSVDD